MAYKKVVRLPDTRVDILVPKLHVKTYFRPFSGLLVTIARHLNGGVLELRACFVNIYMHYKHGSNTVLHHGYRNRITSQDFHGLFHSFTDTAPHKPERASQGENYLKQD